MVRLLAITILLLNLCSLGCSERVIYRDYPVSFPDTNQTTDYMGSAELVPGIYEEQLFNPLDEGDPLHIIHGFQGGVWVHLSLRVSGMSGSGMVWANLGPGIGEIEYSIKLIRTAEGFFEAYDIPIPVPFDGDKLEALYGQEATLTVRFTVGDVEAEAERRVVLEEG